MKWIIAILFMLSCHIVMGQQAQSSLDTNVVLIGDHTMLTLDVQIPSNAELQWHTLDSAYAGIEILRLSEIDTLSVENEIRYTQEINLIPFDSGYYALTPIAFPFKIDGNWDTIRSNSLALKVETIPIDTTQAIKPIKPPISIPWHWKDALPYAGAALGILLVVALLYFLLSRKSKEPETKEVIVDERPASQIALEKLAALELKQYWQKGKVKHYYVELTYILREYIENRFDSDALESTSEEIISSLNTTNIKTTLKERIRHVLDWADMVKFAKASPSGDVHVEALKTVKKFIRKTSVKQEVEHD